MKTKQHVAHKRLHEKTMSEGVAWSEPEAREYMEACQQELANAIQVHNYDAAAAALWRVMGAQSILDAAIYGPRRGAA